VAKFTSPCIATTRRKRAHSPWRAKSEEFKKVQFSEVSITPQQAHGVPTRHDEPRSEWKGEQFQKVKNSGKQDLAIASNSLAMAS